MNQPPSHEPFLDWDLGGGDESTPSADQTVAWVSGSTPPATPVLNPWSKGRGTTSPADNTRVPGLSGAQFAAQFTLHRREHNHHLGSDLEHDPNQETLTPSVLAQRSPVVGSNCETLDQTDLGTVLRNAGNGNGPGAPPSPDDAPTPFPRRGDGIGGFRLIAELGRGAFGRVFLAEEAGLGNRAVALKVTRAEGDEPRYLARLQHTHIVPIHSVHDDPTTGWRLICMPYYGGANLAQILEAAGSQTAEAGPSTHGIERSLIDALDFVGHPAVADSGGDGASSYRPASGGSAPSGSLMVGGPTLVDHDSNDPAQPARMFLREASSIRAAVWITARLAEGLDHAHSRGLLHRDLKPSNILIAADGTPMLLDFNLATGTTGPEDASKAMMGGTLPYMAPEHLCAFNPRGDTPASAVDERSDIYSLGLILYEMIAGRPPFPGPPTGVKLIDAVRIMTEQRQDPPPSLRAISPEVPPSLDSIVAQCLDPDPVERYARAGDLADDLRRFLDDRPLRFASDRDLRERIVKWARRHPRYLGATPVAVLAVVLLVVAGGSSWSLSRHLDRVSSRDAYRVFKEKFQECQLLLNTSAGPNGSPERGIGLAETALAEAKVENRGRGQGLSWVDQLDSSDRAEARRDLTELIVLVTRAHIHRADRSGNVAKLRAVLVAAVSRLDAVERFDPEPPRALFADRAGYLALLGDADRSARDLARAESTPPRTGRDFYLLGTALMAAHKFDQAEAALDRAIQINSQQFWSWLALGLCHYEQRRYSAAAGEFAVCAVLAPKYAWPWMNRGLALDADERLGEALKAYTKALEIEPEFAGALVNRGITRIKLGDPGAIDDLRRAIALGQNGPSVRSLLAEALAHHGRIDEAIAEFDALVLSQPDDLRIRAVRGTALIRSHPDRASADFQYVLARDTKLPLAWLGLARLQKTENPQAALDAVNRAIALDDRRLDAFELRAWLRGSLGLPATVEDVERLAEHPTRDRLFNAGCSLALLHRSQPSERVVGRAVELLGRAVDLGLPRETLRTDKDLDPIRDEPAFQALVGP